MKPEGRARRPGPPRAIEAVLFDLDGTLVDSAPVIAGVLSGMRAERGRAPVPVADVRRWVSLGAAQLVANTLEVAPGEAPALVKEFRERYGRVPTPAESLFPGARETVAGLAGSRVRLGVCSNKPARLCAKVLEETGLRPYFGAVVGGDSAALPKPHRQPVDDALRALGAPPAGAILVGDSLVDQEAARSAGLPFVFFASGYDDGVDPGAAWARIDALPQLVGLVARGSP